MRILWVGNPPFAPSGYGEQAGLFLPRFQALGHEVAVLCNFGLGGTHMNIGGIDHYPADGAWGNLAFAPAVERFQPDIVIDLQDAWTQNPNAWGDNPPAVGMWTPIDHYPIPPKVHATLMHECIRPIAMTRFGYELMKQADLDPLYVPHGVDTQLFRPQPERHDHLRDTMDIPRDAFLVGMVAANKSPADQDRKGFDQSFQAFAAFAREHPDAYMYVHAQARPAGIGLNLDDLAGRVGMPKGRLRFTPDNAWYFGMPHELVVALYQSFSVLLNCSAGEGFGIPIIEAQACGVPVITSNHSAMPELTHAGWIVDGQNRNDELQKAFWFDPFIPSIKAALEDAYQARGDTELRQAAVAFAGRYDADLVTEKHWKPALDALSAPRKPSQPPDGVATRADRRRADRAARKQQQKKEVLSG